MFVRASILLSLLPAAVHAWLPWSERSAGHDIPSYCEPKNNPCAPHAFVRAQDLAPYSFAHGELRIRLSDECKSHIESVTLSLALEEYEHIRRSSSIAFWNSWWGPSNSYVPAKYETTTRIVWSAEVPLLQDFSFDDRRDVVRKFSVITPDVDNPPATLTETHFPHENDYDSYLQTFTAYRYVARVTLTNGAVHNVVAGFTSFRPAREAEARHDATTLEIVAKPPKEPEDGPWGAPPPPPPPDMHFHDIHHKYRSSSSRSVVSSRENASMTLEAAFPHGTDVVQGENVTMRVRIVSHTIPQDILPLSNTIELGMQLGALVVSSRAEFASAPAPPILRAATTPLDTPSRTDAPVRLTLPLGGAWSAETVLPAPHTLPPGAGSVILVVAFPPVWGDADDGWGVRACNVPPALHALVPVRIVSDLSGAYGRSRNSSRHKHDGRAPVLVAGHIAMNSAQRTSFPMAEPRTTTTTRSEDDAGEVRTPWELWDTRALDRDYALRHEGEVDWSQPDLSLVARTYAGMLWARRYGAQSGVATAIASGTTDDDRLLVQ